MTMPALQAPPQPPAPGPRPRKVPLAPMRQQAAKSMSRLADQVQQAHPDLAVHQHVRDAARVLKAGNEEGAQRHLRAAIFSLTPQSLMRQGVHDDTGHMAARHAMHGVHRHLLLVKDIQDVAAKNQAAIRRDSYGDYESGPSLPHSPVRADPNAGYGPGALAQQPTARQPGGDRALNAPARMNSGGSDPAVADPVGPQPKGSKQFANGGAPWAAATDLTYTWDDLAGVLDLSAETGRLAVTPAPYGKPGGPGLYGVKGNKHSDYFESIVQALMRRGMSKGKASAIAWGSIRRWGAKSKHPEVRAAAIGAQAEEKVAQARAHAHAHAATWDDVAAVVELASRPKVVDLVGPHGYIHGWIYVGGPGLPSVAAHNAALRSKGVTPPTKAHPALTSKPPGVGKPPAKAASAGKAPAAKSAPKAAAKPAAEMTPKPEPAKSAPAGAAAPAASKRPAVSADEADAAEKQAEGISALGQMGGKSTQLAVIKKKSIGDLQAADYGFQQRAAEKGRPDKVLVAHQMVRDEITKRGGKLADLAAPVRVQGAAEVAQREKKALIVAWSSSYRYKGTSEVANNKRIGDFATEMHRLLSTNKQPSKCGPGCQDAHKFLTMVDKEATVQPKELQRGLTLSPAAAERMFKPGKTMDMPAASWTADPDVGASYAKGEGKPGKVKVLIHAAPGAKGMDISALSNWHANAKGAGGENETVTGGRFNVDSVKTEGGVMNVYLTQQGFSAH